LLLIEIGSKIVVGLHEFKTNSSQAPAAFQDISNQLPLLLAITQKLRFCISEDSLSQDAEHSLSCTASGCVRQISEISSLIEDGYRPRTNQT
jgi:hypothetical protein